MKKNWKLITGLFCFYSMCCFCSLIAACSDNESVPNPITPTEPGYENDNEITGEKDLQIEVIKASGMLNNKAANETDLKLSYDGDRKTEYKASMGSVVATFLYEFRGDEIMDYCVYYPYGPAGGYYGAWGEVEVYIREAGAASYDFIKVADKNLGFANLPATFYFEGKKKINAVKFAVRTGEQSWAGASEVQFFRRVNSVFDPLTLFKDATCSELKSGITEAVINACDNPFYKTMAMAMYKDTYPRMFRIQEFSANPHPAVHAKANLINGFSLYENATGISVKPDDKLTVFVGDIPKGEFLSLKVLDWGDKDGNNGKQIFPLLKGFNQFEVTDKGLVYLMYHSENHQTLAPVKVHFATGEVNGYFDIAKHTKEQWKDIINNSTYELFDMIGRRSHITFSSSDFKLLCPDPFELMAVYDEMVDLQEEFVGLNKYNRPLTNRMYVHYHYGTGGAMSAAENHINWNNSTSVSIPTAVKAATFKVNIWGAAHELGHELQPRPGRQRYQGMLEVTNNLVSIYTQLQFGGESRLFNEITSKGTTSFQSEFERAMTYYGAEKRAHNYNMNGVRTVLTKLVPLWQLYLYSYEVLGKDWFKDYYQELLTQAYEGTNGAAQMQVIRIFCDISQLDLLDFFEHTGFLTVTNAPTDSGETTNFNVTLNMINEVKSYVKAKGYAKPDVEFWRLTDQKDNIKAFKEKLDVVSGTCERKDRKLTLKNWKNVAAFEVYNAGALVFVSPHTEFTLPGGTPLTNLAVYAVSATGQKTIARIDLVN